MSADSLVQGTGRWQRCLADNGIVRLIMFAVILLSMSSAGWKLWTACHLRLEHLAWPLVLAIGLATLHRFVNAYGWALVLRSMRLDVDGVAATRVWLIAESRRWLPGGLWGYASRATMANRLGVDSVSAAASMLLELILVIFASGLVAVAGVMVYGRQLEINVGVLQGESVVPVGSGVLLALAVATWLCRRRLLAKLLNLQARYQNLQRMRVSMSGISLAALFFIAMNLLGGLIAVVLMRSVAGGESVPIFAVLAASSTAWCLGFFAFMSPGGLLVREAALAAMLVPWLTYTDGFALAVLTRLAQLIAEAIVIFALALTKRVRKKGQEPIAGTALGVLRTIGS